MAKAGGTIAIEVKGLKELQRKLGDMQGVKAFRSVLLVMGKKVEHYLAQYPSASEANRPRSWTPGEDNSWYERGYGSRWVRKDGGIGGASTSETLGKRWTTKARKGADEVVVGNNASYGPYVQDKEYQPAYHARRGWRTVQGVVEEYADDLAAEAAKVVDQMLAKK